MKNQQKGFIIPAMIAIVLILTIGGGGYIYLESKKVAKVEMENREIEVVASSTDNISTTEIVKEKILATTSSEIKVESNIVDKSISSSTLTKTQNIIAQPNNIPKSTSSTVEKCSDAKCFISAINSCSQTSYQSKNENEFMGSLIKAELLFNLYPSKNNCMLDFKLISYNISPTQDLINFIGDAEVLGGNSPDVLYPKLNKYAQDNTVGKSYTCNITGKNKDFAEVFKNIPTPSGEFKIFKYINEIILIVIPDEESCSGQLIEAIKKQENMQ